MSRGEMTDEERRRFARIEPKGTVILYAGEHVQRGRIANVSEGGMLMSTSVAAPARLLGRAATVELRFDGGKAEWLQGNGKIVRLAAERGKMRKVTKVPLVKCYFAQGGAIA